MSETIFAKIIRGEIPCHRVYEDDAVLAFLDVGPLSEGHTLVIPKEPAPTIDRLSDEAAQAVGRALPRIARAVMAATGSDACNILQNNGPLAHQEVMHVHFHVIPKTSDADGLRVSWKPIEFNHERGAELASKIRAGIDAPNAAR